MSNVQYVVIGIFILFAIVGVLIFAGFGIPGAGQDGSNLSVEVWGTVPATKMNDISYVIISSSPDFNMTYQEFRPENFENEVINALAEGRGPDIVIISQDFLASNENKLSLIPWTIISERYFKDNFIEAGEVFTTPLGTYAIPFAVDPLVMYWNRDIFNNESIPNPPKSWEAVLGTSGKTTKITEGRIITQSGLPFGEYSNVRNAKEIVSLLAMQAGSPIVKRDEKGNPISAVFDSVLGVNNPFDSALSFFTQFTDPLKSTYSWNKAFPDSQTAFSRGQTSLYFGFASEAEEIKAKNPNLNFDVAEVPQASVYNRELTYANVLGMAILKSSPKQNAALQAIYLLTSAPAISEFIKNTNNPPVRRDLLAELPANPSGQVFFKSALKSRTPLLPKRSISEGMFKNMIESVVTGRQNVTEAVRFFSSQIDEIYKK